MLIKIINTTYGHRPILPNGQKSHYVIPVRPGEPPIEVEQAEGERLIALGVAAEVTPGKITALEPEAPEGATEAQTEGNAEKVSLDSMSFNELKAYAQELGINTQKIKSKVGMITEIMKIINGADESIPFDELPDLTAEDVVD